MARRKTNTVYMLTPHAHATRVRARTLVRDEMSCMLICADMHPKCDVNQLNLRNRDQTCVMLSVSYTTWHIPNCIQQMSNLARCELKDSYHHSRLIVRNGIHAYIIGWANNHFKTYISEIHLKQRNILVSGIGQSLNLIQLLKRRLLK